MGRRFAELVRQRDEAKASGNLLAYDRLSRFVNEIENSAARLRRAKRWGVRPIDLEDWHT